MTAAWGHVSDTGAEGVSARGWDRRTATAPRGGLADEESFEGVRQSSHCGISDDYHSVGSHDGTILGTVLDESCCVRTARLLGSCTDARSPHRLGYP